MMVIWGQIGLIKLNSEGTPIVGGGWEPIIMIQASSLIMFGSSTLALKAVVTYLSHAFICCETKIHQISNHPRHKADTEP